MLGRLSAIVTAPALQSRATATAPKPTNLPPPSLISQGTKCCLSSNRPTQIFRRFCLEETWGGGGGELGGSNWGVIEVTKRVERNIPGIPGHSSDHLPYLPTLGPAGFLLLHEIFFSLDTLSHEVILAAYLDLVLVGISSFASNQNMLSAHKIKLKIALISFLIEACCPLVATV